MPLILEYEAALAAQRRPSLVASDVQSVLDYLCAVGRLQDVFFLWRPWLPDPKDDMVLELAVAAGAAAVVTHNVRDFRGADRFGVRVWRPSEFLEIVGLRS